ncbi:MAG: 50S ribosomal protein L13 [Hyphomonadaceae bacterium JAD_PAG50586_4]|nr:MAG: 50S ribosomal protein L13 [Hyphomonadaceae bacterium JAD_PAG50586_4]
MRTLSTRSAKASEITNGWIVVDAEGVVVGRLASFIALRLRGKHRADFTPHADTGDNVIIINAEKVAFTGKKLTDKVYYRHTGHPGGIKERVAGKVLEGKHPERVLEKAVERMMPKESPLARKQLSKLHVYAGTEHPHAAQKPVTIDYKSKNRKNSRIG